jgi:hypothetical protein
MGSCSWHWEWRARAGWASSWGGGRPGESLHFVYAALALGAVPVAAAFARGAQARVQGFATLGGALVAILVIARLFQTG